MILSTAFFWLSTMKFFLLRLDRFIQLMYTSSVIISLEFVFSNLRLTVSEGLLPLSDQESPNLFAFRVLPLNFVTLRVTYVTANNGFPRSIMTHRLTDGDVIVVEVFREQLLGQGLLGVLDISLRDEVVVGLITCGGVLFVRVTQLLKR